MNQSAYLHMLARTGLVFAVMAGAGTSLNAQPGSMRNHPTPQDCRVWINQLGASPRSAAYRRARAENRLSECGNAGAEALAGALHTMRRMRDTVALGALTFQASYARHPAVLAAALSLADDRAAPAVVRAAGLSVALRQHDIARGLGGDLGRLSTVPVGRFCVPDYILHVGGYNSSVSLPADYREEIKSVTSRIAQDSAEPLAIRELAACVERGLVEPDAWDESPGWVESPFHGRAENLAALDRP